LRTINGGKLLAKLSLVCNLLFDASIWTEIIKNEFCFWNCSQQWLLDQQDLIRERQADLAVLSEEEYQKLFIFFSNCNVPKGLVT